MKEFLIVAVTVFIAYAVLTTGSWSYAELIAGIILSIVIAAVSFRLHGRDKILKRSPFRFLQLIIYIFGPFLIEVASANLDVAIRVFTKKIRPGIIKYNPNLKTNVGAMIMANSITLTPGTLTVDIDESTNELYVHVLNINEGSEKQGIWEGRDIFKFVDLSAWIRRITE